MFGNILPIHFSLRYVKRSACGEIFLVPSLLSFEKCKFLLETRKSQDFHIILIRVIWKPQRISLRLPRHN